MKRSFLLAGALAGGLLPGAPASAQQNPVYFGIKAGQMDADPGGFGVSNNYGLLAGYDFLEDVTGTLSLEVEYTRQFSKGDVVVGGTRGDWRVETLAAYGAYRTVGDVYLKAKVGWLQQDRNVSIAGAGLASERDNGFSFGAGAGYRFNSKVGLEVEYTVIENDIAFLSVGYFTHF